MLFEFGKYEKKQAKKNGSVYKFIAIDKEALKAEYKAESEPKKEVVEDFYEEDKYEDWEDPLLYNTDTVTNHAVACDLDFFGNTNCKACTSD